jgi:hypothetical protein
MWFNTRAIVGSRKRRYPSYELRLKSLQAKRWRRTAAEADGNAEKSLRTGAAEFFRFFPQALLP